MATKTRFSILSSAADGTTSPLSSAEVALIREADLGTSIWPHADLKATHSLVGSHFEPDDGAHDPTEGRWLLVVRARDHSPVVQKLSFSTNKGIVRALGGWGATGADATARTVSIVNYGLTKPSPDPAGPESSLITVTLFPAQHFVGLASPKNDATYQLFSKGRFAYLFDRGKLNAGAVGVLIDAPKKHTQIVVKAQSKSSSALVVLANLPGPDPNWKPTIVDFYRALHDIGTSSPGSVVEAAVWSHAWHQGPIIWNTGDAFEQLIERDPVDTDGRPKDWHPSGIVATQFPRLKDAFAKDGVFRIGGCSHMTNVVQEARSALQQLKLGTPRDRFYEVPLPEGWMFTTLDLTKRSIGQYVQSKTFVRYDEQGEAAGHCTYLGRAAQALPITVFGAPPGCEGNMGTMKASSGPALSTMKIVSKPYKDARTNASGGFENQSLYEYFEKEFGSHFETDELNYTNYTRLLATPLPGPIWDTRRSLSMKSDSTNRKLRVATGLEFVRERSSGSFERPVTHVEGGQSGHLFVVKKARVESAGVKKYPDGASVRTIFLGQVEPDGTKVTSDLGIFVREDGHVLLRVRPAGGAFAPWSGNITVFELEATTGDWIDSGTVLASDEIQLRRAEWTW